MACPDLACPNFYRRPGWPRSQWNGKSEHQFLCSPQSPQFSDFEARVTAREIKERGEKSEIAEGVREIPVQIHEAEIPPQIDPSTGAVIADRKEKLVGIVLGDQIKRFEVVTLDVSWRQSLDGIE